jgi:hypothetical protein
MDSQVKRQERMVLRHGRGIKSEAAPGLENDLTKRRVSTSTSGTRWTGEMGRGGNGCGNSGGDYGGVGE